jgi:hypothetical protein
MVKGEWGGACCCAGSERATTRRSCQRTAAQDRQVAELVAPWLLLYVPAGQALQEVLPGALQ